MAIEDNRLISERLGKLSSIRGMGVEPYPYSFEVTAHSKELLEKFSDLSEKSVEKFSVAGRIMQFRDMGKASFFHIQDEQGRIQVYARQDEFAESYDILKRCDIGDIVGISGSLFRTKTGELTVHADSFTLLCKSLRPLPEKYHGLQDKELRYRKRYLDLIMNQDVRDVFVKRSFMLKLVRQYFDNLGFMEVETPALQTIYGGANARPFVTHINAWDMKMYMSISPELYLKRLLVGGFEKVYTICKNFRNEGVDATHNPEFTMLEFYHAYVDYEKVMEIFENMVEFLAKSIHGSTKIKRTFQGKDVEMDFKSPWKRMTMESALEEIAGVDVSSLDADGIRQLCTNYNVVVEGSFTRGLGIQLLFEELCEDKLIQPVHIIDHPKESTPLCKLKRGNPELIERFESYCLGAEICNAYSELNDPIRQRELLEEQARELRGGVDEAHPMDEDFVQAIEYGMPPAGGLGFGVDRLAIMLLGVDSIRDVILFPTMKPLSEDLTVEGQDKNLKEEIAKSLDVDDGRGKS